MKTTMNKKTVKAPMNKKTVKAPVAVSIVEIYTKMKMYNGDGSDCSGIVQELLASVGVNPSGELTSHQLYEWFSKNGVVLTAPVPGALVFFGTKEHVSHIALCLDDKFMLADAAICPIARRKDLVCIVLPKYPF